MGLDNPFKQMSPLNKLLIRILGFLIGVGAGGFLVFQIFFLSKVLPHGGF